MSIAQTVIADPPWSFRDALPGHKRGAVKHYRCMPLRDIESFWERVAELVAPDARLFLWRVASMQEEALRVVRAWGFTLKSEVVWVKTRDNGEGLRIGMGRQVRNAHEVCLIATRGVPERLSAAVPSVVFAPRARHSAKPDAFYELVERLSPGPYLELFARRHRDNWICSGDEIDEDRS